MLLQYNQKTRVKRVREMQADLRPEGARDSMSEMTPKTPSKLDDGRGNALSTRAALRPPVRKLRNAPPQRGININMVAAKQAGPNG